MEEEPPQGGGSNSLKRKFSDIDGDQTPDCPSSPKIIDSNGCELKVYEVAKKRNIIALLGTGTDKSGIVKMLIKAMSSSDTAKRLIIFLAPNVNLVKQQCCEINFKVEDYFGAKGVDKWTSQRWEEEVSEHDVLVMTPQILLDALRSAFLRLEMVCLLVIDECHRTTGLHPYAKIMKEFYHKSTYKPKIFGMTTPAAIRKGQVSELESLMDSQIFDPEEQKGVEKFATTVKEGPIFYDPPPFCSLETLHLKFDASLLRLQDLEKGSIPNMENKFETYQKRLSIDYREILHCLENLGLICAHLAAEVCLEKISNPKEESEFCKECSMVCKEFLEDILSTIAVYLQQEDKDLVDLRQNHLSAVNSGLVSPKLQELFHLLGSFRGEKQKPCLILVERIISAEVIERFVKKEASLAYLTVFLIGNNTSTDASTQTMQTEISDSFHDGKVNLLFITDVVEEGFQVPNCSCMVCFDLPQTVCSYLLSQEHAKQSNSKSIMFLERGNPKQRDHLYEIMRRELPIPDPETPNLLCPPPGIDGHDVKKSGAMIIPDSDITVFEEAATTQTMIDPLTRNGQLACKKLHQLDALNDNAISCNVKVKVASSKSKSSSSAAGLARFVVYFMVIVLVIISPCVYGEEIPDHREIEVQQLLKRLNKPALKSIKSDDGDIIDCVPVASQPAFDHPLLKNHTIQMRPSFIPKGDHSTNTKEDAKTITQVWHKNGRCPENTVPIRRTKREDILRAESTGSFGTKTHPENPNHEYAAMVLSGSFHGTQFALNLWKPDVEDVKEFSLAQTWLNAGEGNDFNSIEAGWQVYPDHYDTPDLRFFIYWTANGYKPGQGQGCYNHLCSGFIQTNNRFVLGGVIASVSQYDGEQQYYSFQIRKSDDKWWLMLQNENVGYWPVELFNALKKEATIVSWGGEIINLRTGGRHTETDMGSGHFADEGMRKASVVRNIMIVDGANTLREPQGLLPSITNANCYNVKVGNDGTNYGKHFFFGGPGRNDNCP